MSALMLLSSTLALGTPHVLQLSGDLYGVHDPVIIRQAATYYVFSTGSAHPGHIPIRCSNNLTEWKLCGHVFDEIPAWALREIPGTTNLWAPDISRYKDGIRLYYAVSTFGHNDSAIGLATNKTLDPSSPDYKWVDEGMVVRSRAGQDDWNAIDPNLVFGADGAEWLVFGSFWGGIKMVRIDPESGKPRPDDKALYSLAARPHAEGQPDTIEAPFIVHRGDYYYLFVSFDFCCRGTKSNYNVVVGRSRNVSGPYADEHEQPMITGGGSRLTESTEHWRGPGHEAILLEPTGDLMLFHAYDGVTGKSRLQISTMEWENGWPRVGALP